MRSKLVVLELLPSHLELAVFTGARCTAGTRLPVRLDHDMTAWQKEVVESAERLGEAVASLGAAGLPTIVVYRSPTQAVDLVSLPLKPAEVREAARLQCLEALPHPTDESVSEATLVGRDGGGARQHHAVAAADRNDTAACIVELVEAAGLSFVAAAPSNAVMMARLVGELLQARKSMCGRLYVGEQNSYFLVVERGTLVFARQVSIGVETFLTSLTRPVRRRGGESTQLSADDARRVLFEHGPADRDTVVHQATGLTGDDVMPLLQPVLQRFVVEVRQSLRFGLTAEQREQLGLEMSGPGAAVPNLGELLSRELSIALTRDEKYRAYDWTAVGGPGSQLADVADSRAVPARLNLQTLERSRSQGARRLVRWLWTGAAAAVAVIAFDGVRYHLRLDDLRERAAAMQARDSGQDALRETQTRLLGIVQAMGELEHTIDVETTGQPGCRAVLQELSRSTLPSIRFTNVSVERRGAQAHVDLHGFAFHAGDGPDASELESFIGRLEASPLFTSVELGSVQRVSVAGVSCRQFRATMLTESTPTAEVLETLAAAGAAGTPGGPQDGAQP